MFKLIEVKVLQNYRIWLRYEDGTEGEIDFSDLVGQGVFVAFEDRAFFEQAHVGEFGQIAWTDDVELDPDALYMRLTGKTPEELFPVLSKLRVGESSNA